MPKWKPDARILALAAAAAILTACAAPMGEQNEPDDLTYSRLTQSPPGTPVPPPVDAGDIAIAGQYAAHAIMDLPEVANVATPPLVQFTGVTSIVTGPEPVDTEPYTTLLRDRLLVITREKLRFVERTLPPLVTHKKKAAPAETPENPSYQILAELHGHSTDDFYKVQIQFVDIHSGAVLFNGLYRIGKEEGPMQEAPAASETTTSVPPPNDNTSSSPPVDNNVPATPTVKDPSGSPEPGVTQ
ncbi:MAG TPA: hypothetical protein VL981_13235 [Candidatus Methylacidiphilales bacterium]|nr:hypothetical protein [Candidatus Methylacidiphilales bacterium]